MERYPITQKGFENLEAELKNLKQVERPAIIAQIAEAREHAIFLKMRNIMRRVKNCPS